MKIENSLQYGLLSELTISKLERQDEGLYYCITWNSYGRDESLIHLTIKGRIETRKNEVIRIYCVNTIQSVISTFFYVRASRRSRKRQNFGS